MISTSVLNSVLIVDQCQAERESIRSLLHEAWPKARVFEAHASDDALVAISRQMPDVVLTELCGSNPTGIGLAATLKNLYRELPVITVAHFGNFETTAVGQLSMTMDRVPNLQTARWLIPTIELLCERAELHRNHFVAMTCSTRQDLHFVIPNDLRSAGAIITCLQEKIAAMGLLERRELPRLGIALHEALSNAIYHGNLELNSDLRDDDDSAYYDLAQIRRRQQPYMQRRVHIQATLLGDFIKIVIRDEGPGFDVSVLQKPFDENAPVLNHGFGMGLITNFMDMVTYNDYGNEVTLTKLTSRAAMLLSQNVNVTHNASVGFDQSVEPVLSRAADGMS